MNSLLAIETRTVSAAPRHMLRAVPWAMPEAVLCDLDGTLIDSVSDLTLSINELLASEHLPALEEAQVRSMCGRSIRMLVRRAYLALGIALDVASLDCRTDAMLEMYQRRHADRTRLMPGVREMVDFFVSGGARLALVTSKPQAVAEAVLDRFGLSGSFSVVIGNADRPQFEVLLTALSQLGVVAADAILVGDSPTDIAAAQAARLRPVMVRCGYATGELEAAYAVVADPGAIPSLFMA